MIRLIVTDIDGTLLSPFQKVSKEFNYILKELNKRNVIFALASGRNYQRIKNVFGEDLNIVYISENGAYVRYKNHVLSKTTMCKNTLNELVDFLRTKKYCNFVFSDKDYNYIDNKFVHKLGRCFKFETNLVEDIKISIDFKEITKCSILVNPFYHKKLLNELKERFANLNIMSSSMGSIDVTDKNVDKVNAVEMLRKLHSLEEDNVMVFGNHINDYKMLEKYKYSFAVANAQKDVKRVANFIAPSSIKNGVLSVIKEYVLV